MPFSLAARIPHLSSVPENEKGADERLLDATCSESTESLFTMPRPQIWYWRGLVTHLCVFSLYTAIFVLLHARSQNKTSMFRELPSF